MGIGLTVVLAVGAVGGWMFFRSDEGDKTPIVVGSTSTPSMVDPGGAYDAGAAMLMSNVFQSLLTFESGREQPVPDAAESCEFTDNQLTVYRCTLREGLTFSSGREVTPEDVKFSYDRILAMADRAAREEEDDSIPEDEKFTHAGPSSLLATLEAVRTDGRDIIFELNQPDATFPFIVAGSAGAIVDRESYEEDEPRDDGKAVGSGPYVLTAYEPYEYAELEPNPDYVGANEVPELPITVRYFTQAEDGTPAEQLLADAWEAGEIDVNDGKMPPEVMAELNPSDPDYRFAESSGASIRVLGFNTREGAPMADGALRHAAAAMLDREAVTRHVQQDTVEALYSLIPVGFTGHGTPYYDQYRDTDAESLRQELEDAGHELPVSFNLAYSRGAANHAEAELIEQQLEADGLFDVEITYYDWSEFVPTLYGSHPYDAYLVGWRADYPDPATFTDELLGPGDGLNTGFSSHSIDQRIAAAQAEPDRGRAAEDYRIIHDEASETAPLIPIWQDKRIIISDPEITGIQHLSSSSGVWRLWELRRI
ncbi:ABC transporter substrate-binding protein [Streptomyces litchfieldiae]|uniref:ABC transporter substrate-binding protein n=1 Tax=Streptomyces litchfieldiae TaxID=3075543 RepID=A0ABU2N165_9ACTN|nr:ABC transporter substrate-binding protein [Streptomyces sp. DSM 44938]MDT0347248.1 ABC transporter substrate-binding protein [Streptomyces sp. DSM 44938]